MTDFNFEEDNIVNKYLSLQRSDFLSDADKERLENFLDTYLSAKNDFIKQLNVMNEINITKFLDSNKESDYNLSVG